MDDDQIKSPEQKESLLKKLDFDQPKIDPRLIAGLILIILAGIGTGFGISRLTGGTSTEGQRQQLAEDTSGIKVKVGETYGETSDLFTDEAQGVLELNINDGEGTHKLIREGGESQTAYLTSSLIDLDLFIGREVKVWGETYAAQKVGWLMDVGAVKVLK